MSCHAVNHKSKSVGKYFKFTKKEYSWDFVLENKTFNLKLFHSKISGRYEIKLNGKTNYKCQQRDKFYHGFEILNHSIKIKSIKDSFELFIDNCSFGDILKGTTIIDSNVKFNNNNRFSHFSNNNQINQNGQNVFKKRFTDYNIPQFSNQNQQIPPPNNNSNNFFTTDLNKKNSLFNPNNIPNTNNMNFNNNSSNFTHNIPNFNNNLNKIPNLQNNTNVSPKLETQSSEKFFENLDFLPIND